MLNSVIGNDQEVLWKQSFEISNARRVYWINFIKQDQCLKRNLKFLEKR